ncbi:hypothetical protein HA402_007002 [Bradysia odoriphaga]|nr:hypothetical protein HA402_007002 [Bradysia odoriphaga]
MCQMGRTPCTKISCSKASEANTFISYTSNPAYYVFCSKDDTGFSTLMFKCPNEEFEEFDAKSKVCKFKCKTRGNFQDPDDCGKYYYCSGAKAQPISGNCPGELVFDGTRCNEDKSKCQYKPQVNNGDNVGDGLSKLMPVEHGSEVYNFVESLKEDIIEKICKHASKTSTCLTDMVAKNYRKQAAADATEYFVSVTGKLEGNITVYYVKISSEPPAVEVKSVKPGTDVEEIESF